VKAGAWLAPREIAARTGRASQAAAVAAALGAGLEFAARGREESAAVRIDGVGPALRIVPAGVGGSQLMRFDLGRTLLPAEAVVQAVSVLGEDLREARERLIAHHQLAGRNVPIIGTAGAAQQGVELGSALAAALGHPPTIDLGGGARPVDRIREVTGTAEDGAVFLPLQEAQALAGLAGSNEIQIYLRAGLAPKAAARFEAAELQVKLVPGDRGAPADEEVQGALAGGRRAIPWLQEG
jgi:hypothetical protein